jgi:hypothetical protein
VTGALLFAAASLAFTAPDERASVPAGPLEVRLNATGAANDAHAHLVLDGGAALEADLASPVKLPALQPGPHTLRAVLVGRDHQSVRGRGAAFALVRFWSGPRPADDGQARAAEKRAWPEPKKPNLTLVLPQGGSAERGGALLDLHVSGAQLSRRGHKVRVVVDKKELPLLADDQPLRLKLKPGPHRVTVDLLDARATKVQPFNRTDRSFTLP